MSDEDRGGCPHRGPDDCHVVRERKPPSMVIHCGGCKFELIVGYRVGAAEDAYQFAMGLAYVALQLATRWRCLTYPRQVEAD